MSNKYHGKNGIVYASADGTSAAVPIGGMSSFTVGGDADKVDTTEFGASNKTSEIGFPDFTGNIGGFYATDETTIWQALAAVQAGGYTNLYLYPSRNVPSRYIAAQAWISLNLDTGVDKAVALTGQWGAKGVVTNKLGG